MTNAPSPAVGVGTRDLAECLALQLRARPRSEAQAVAIIVAKQHLDLLARRDLKKLVAATGADELDRPRGWDVVVNYSRDPVPAEAVAAQCRELGAAVLVVKADIAVDADCRRLAAEVQQRFGRADVLVENFSPGAMDRLGVGAAELRKVNPRIIYASISAYGQNGPYEKWPGFDQIAQGRCAIVRHQFENQILQPRIMPRKHQGADARVSLVEDIEQIRGGGEIDAPVPHRFGQAAHAFAKGI